MGFAAHTRGDPQHCFAENKIRIVPDGGRCEDVGTTTWDENRLRKSTLYLVFLKVSFKIR